MHFILVTKSKAVKSRHNPQVVHSRQHMVHVPAEARVPAAHMMYGEGCGGGGGGGGGPGPFLVLFDLSD